MAALLLDSPPAQPGEPQQGEADAPAQQAGPAPGSCAKCGAPLAAGQDWCLQCGAGAPGSLGPGARRSTTVVLAAVALALVLGAGAAAYAALHQTSHRAPTVTTTVAQAIAPPPTVTTPATPSKGTTHGALKPTVPEGIVKPPKIPLTASTPKASTAPKIPAVAPAAKPTAPAGAVTTPAKPITPAASGESTPSGEAGAGESQPAAILLDTNAASTYNPYELPAAGFGDPSLAIDGDPATAWTAQVDPATAPKLAEGLLIDLKSPQKLSAAVVLTSTPGLTIQLYGANTSVAPSSITDPSWVPLSSSIVDKKKSLRLKLRHSAKAFKFVTLWISRAPAASVGTEQAPGHVSVNELELFPAS